MWIVSEYACWRVDVDVSIGSTPLGVGLKEMTHGHLRTDGYSLTNLDELILSTDVDVTVERTCVVNI